MAELLDLPIVILTEGADGGKEIWVGGVQSHEKSDAVRGLGVSWAALRRYYGEWSVIIGHRGGRVAWRGNRWGFDFDRGVFEGVYAAWKGFII